MKRCTHVTATKLVLDLLRSRDDFMSERMIRMALPECPSRRINAALFSLRAYQAVGVIIEKDGVGWWYAEPEARDRRSRTISERVDEEPGTRGTAGRKKKAK